MKSLSEIVADNAEIEQRIADKQAASIRRLKQRIAIQLHDDRFAFVRRDINRIIDAWAKAEKRRAGAQ